MSAISSGLVYYVVFLFSTTLHEAAHAWAAMRGGDLTAYHGGQVSLDPRAHIRREPFGMVIIPLLSVLLSGWPFGFASAPYNQHWAMRHPKRAAWMALAGPAGNLGIVVGAVIFIRLGTSIGLFEAPSAVSFDRIVTSQVSGVWPTVAFLLSVFFSLNLLLAVFNLIPVPPLDGSGVIPFFLSPEATSWYQNVIWSNQTFSWLGILLAWQVFDVIFHPLWLFVVNFVHPGFHYG